MPWIELEGAVNVRDVGGLPAGDGGETVAGRCCAPTTCSNYHPPTSRGWSAIWA